MIDKTPIALSGLYAITPDGLPAQTLLDQVAAALRGGVRLVQYRDKTAAATRRAELARALTGLCRQHGARCIINDDVALAVAVDADGVHLGGTDGDLAAARALLGPARLLGASCYADFALARAAQAAGADYVAFGAVCASPTKPQAVRAPWDLLARARAELAVPVCAIGGITLADAPALIAAGADMLAVITDLFGAADITGRATAFQNCFAGERS